MSDKDDLFKGIDEATDSLFDQYIVKPEATPAATPDAELKLEIEQPKPTPAATTEPELELRQKPTPDQKQPVAASGTPTPDTGDQLFNTLEEALLTIDWEVNHANILKARDILAQLVATQGWEPSSPIGKITLQMDQVLASMLESPENSPTSAPSQLKHALQAIKDAYTAGTTSEANNDKLLDTTLSNLRAILPPESTPEKYPSQDISNDLQAATPVETISQTANQLSPGETVPEATIAVLKQYATAITEAIRLTTPMENLFASRPAMAKLHSVTKRFTAQLSSQQELLKNTFANAYSSYSGLGTVHGWLEAQLDVLKDCVNRISKLENLFAKTTGYEKLFTRSTQIRKILEKQVNALTIASGGSPTQHQFDLTGEYPAVIRPGKEAPAAAVSAVVDPEAMIDQCVTLAKSIEHKTTDNPQDTSRQIRKTLEKIKIALAGSALHTPGAAAAASAAATGAKHNTKCRWDWLLKTSWGGQLVGIAPEQIAFESKSTFPANSFNNKTTFSLKKLKSTPWTNLQGMFSGELAELDNSELNNMELEISQPPASFPGSANKKVYLVILYVEGQGKVYLIDSATEAISVAEEALWIPGTSSQADIAGTLTVYGSTMPVVSID